MNPHNKIYQPPKRKDFCIYVHDKIKNSEIYQTSVKNIGVKKKIYSDEIEKFVTNTENKVKKEFRKIREARTAIFFNPFPIYQFMMAQLVRTPKFQKKL